MVCRITYVAVGQRDVDILVFLSRGSDRIQIDFNSLGETWNRTDKSNHDATCGICILGLVSLHSPIFLLIRFGRATTQRVASYTKIGRNSAVFFDS